MAKWLIVILVCLAAGYWLGQRSIDEIVDTFFPTSPREAYVHALERSGLAETALGRTWLRSAEAALREAPRVGAPFREAGYIDPARPEAVAYRFPIRAGQRLRVDVRLEPPGDALLFLDLYRLDPDGGEPRRVASADSGETTLEYEPRRDANYLVRLQPELLAGGRYTLTAAAEPTLAFPVEGAGVRSVHSVFGDARDGGARDHHGIDIFAPRGTPVLAATAGIVRSVRETPRGGRVVWLRDEARGQSLYYAHLDRQLVEAGTRVEPGDTLGLVGNTGNARTTPPHLHFGIYRRGSGPVDPLPFVRPVPAPADPAVPLDAVGGWRRVASDSAPLRAAPAADAPVLAELERHLPVLIAAAAGDWFRVRLPDGRSGFLAAGATEEAAPLRTAELDTAAMLLDRPAADAAGIAELSDGEQVEVLGRFNGHLYVRARGREAWIGL